TFTTMYCFNIFTCLSSLNPAFAWRGWKQNRGTSICAPVKMLPNRVAITFCLQRQRTRRRSHLHLSSHSLMLRPLLVRRLPRPLRERRLAPAPTCTWLPPICAKPASAADERRSSPSGQCPRALSWHRPVLSRLRL